MARYRSAAYCFPLAVAALALAGFSTWLGWSRPLALIPAALFLLTCFLLLFLATRPPIVLRESGWSVGERSFRWGEVESVEIKGWNTPLFLKITLSGNRRVRLIYPGDPQTTRKMLRQIGRLARNARIGRSSHNPRPEDIRTAEPICPPPRYRLVRPEDEAEIDRLCQRLKTAGTLHCQNSAEEHKD